MRIRLTIDIQRHNQPQPAEMERDVDMGSLVERVEPQRIGFTANPGRTPEPDEWDGQR